MVAHFQHLEILGPRAGLDRWLVALQDLGVCHVADAMRGLEGQPDIGRPIPTTDETRARRIRGEAGRALRAVAHVLPLSPRSLPEQPTPEERRPDWALGFDGGANVDDLEALRDEASSIAGELRDALQRVDVAEAAARAMDESAPAPDRERTRAAEREARTGLQDVLAGRGQRARHLLDSIEDADSRQALHDRLAATEHVVAARIYVRPEDADPLRQALHREFADHVVIRALDESDDMPTLPKRLAPYPFAVLHSLGPARIGEVGMASLLALAAPLVTALVWADIAGGLLLIAVGAVLGLRTGPGSPRRDTAVLAQLAGLVALIAGVCVGRMFGPAGQAWFGTGWGLLGAPAAAGRTWPFAQLVLWLGTAAGALALVAGFVTFAAHGRGQTGRRHQAAGLALSATAAFALALSTRAPWLAVLAIGAGLVFWRARGSRALLFQFGLDLVGFLRLIAVGAGGILLAHATFGGWVAPHWAAIVLAPITLWASPPWPSQPTRPMSRWGFPTMSRWAHAS